MSAARERKSNVTYAQSLAGDFGWHVYPVNRAKVPLWSKTSQFPNGSLDASSDEATISELFAPWPDALVAVRLDRSGLMAIDIDRHEGVDGVVSFQMLANNLGGLPTTVAQRSISGKGFHGLFKSFGDVHKNVRGYPGVDFIHQGYIVLNQWVQGQSPWELPVATLPSVWKSELAVKVKPVRDAIVSKSDDPYRDISAICYVKDLAGLTPNRRMKVSCPGHDDWNPSLEVYSGDRDGWYCHQCGRGGSVYDFAALVAGLDSDWGADSALAAKLISAVQDVFDRLYVPPSEF